MRCALYRTKGQSCCHSYIFPPSHYPLLHVVMAGANILVDSLGLVLVLRCGEKETRPLTIASDMI